MHRNYNMEILRAACAFLVVCIHTLPLSITTSTLNDFTTLIWQSISRIGLPIFFMLSGYFLIGRKTTDNPLVETLNRATRTIIPFAIYFAIHYFITPIIANTPIPNIESYINLLIYGANKYSGHYWFVYSIIGVYILAPAISIAFNKTNYKEMTTVLLILISVKFYIVYTPVLFNLGIKLPNIAFPKLDTWIIYFIAGHWIALSTKNNIKLAACTLTASILLTILAIHGGPKYKPFDMGANMYLACISLMYIAHASPEPAITGIGRKLVDIISRHSYGIYLIHIAVITVLVKKFNIYTRMYEVWIYSAIPVTIMIFAISLIISYIVDRMIAEKLIDKVCKNTATRKNKL